MSMQGSVSINDASDPFPNWVNIASMVPFMLPATDPAFVDGINQQPYFLYASGVDPQSLVLMGSCSASSDPRPSAASMLWRITPDGRILSGLLSGYVLSVLSDGNIVVEPEQFPVPSSQLWTVTPVNSGKNGAFYVQSQSAAGLSVQVQMPNGTSPLEDGMQIALAGGASAVASSFQWYLTPWNPLPTVSDQAKHSFVSFGGVEQVVYSAISHHLFPNSDLRRQYGNVTIPMITLPPELPAPTGQTQAAWNAAWSSVTAQLGKELLWRNTVMGLFIQTFSQEGGIFASSIADQLDAIAFCGLQVQENTTNVGAIVATILSSLLYTVLNIVSGGIGAAATKTIAKVASVAIAAVANLAQMAIAAAQEGSPNVVPVDPLQLTIAELWAQLNETATGIDHALGEMFMGFFQDPVKLSTVFDFQTSPGPGTLGVAALPFATKGAIMGKSWFVAVVQAIMKATFVVYVPFEFNPSTYLENVTYVEIAPGRYVSSGGSGKTTNTTFPAPQLFDQLAAYGVNLTDIAYGNNGWNLAQALNGPVCSDFCVVTILNSTPFTLNVSAKAPNPTESWTVLSGRGAVTPSQSQVLLGVPRGTPGSVTGSFIVTRAEDQASVGSFSVALSNNGLEGETPTFSGAVYANGFTGSPQIWGASLGPPGNDFESYSGSVALEINWAPVATTSTSAK